MGLFGSETKTHFQFLFAYQFSVCLDFRVSEIVFICIFHYLFSNYVLLLDKTD